MCSGRHLLGPGDRRLRCRETVPGRFRRLFFVLPPMQHTAWQDGAGAGPPTDQQARRYARLINGRSRDDDPNATQDRLLCRAEERSMAGGFCKM